MLSAPASPRAPHTASGPRAQPPIAAVVLLLLTAVLALLWSHNKLMWVDELLVLHTDTAGGFREIVHIQRFYPVSLDPLAYHFASHLSTLLFGANAFAIRLPALIGFLIMQVCLFFFVRTIAGSRAATIALAFPALTGTLYYAAEARPYGMLLGVFGIAALSYQYATRRLHTRAAFIGLVLSLVLAPNTHYFGVLLFIPILTAEAVRTIQRRRLDWPILSAIFLSMLGIAGILPFQPAVRQFREHYYNLNVINLHSITLAYRNLLIGFDLSAGTFRLLMFGILLCGIAVIALCVRLSRRHIISLPANEWALLLVLAGLPILGYLLGRFVTHSMEVRYVLGALFGVAALSGIALASWLRRDLTYPITIALLTAAIVVIASCHIDSERQKTSAIRASLVVSPEMKAKLLSAPDHLIYINEGGRFEVINYYEPDPEIRSHLAFVYSADEELKYFHRNTASLGDEHEARFTNIPFVPWAQFKRTAPHILISYNHSNWDWTPQALVADHAQVTPLGEVLGGNALIVNQDKQ